MSILPITHFIVENEDGSINHEVSKIKFSRELKQYIKSSYVNKEEIKLKIHEIFDKTPGITISKFKSYLLGKLNISPNNIKVAEIAIAEVLKDMSGEWESGAELYTGKGVNGGTFRWKDANDSKVQASIERVKELTIKKKLS